MRRGRCGPKRLDAAHRASRVRVRPIHDDRPGVVYEIGEWVGELDAGARRPGPVRSFVELGQVDLAAAEGLRQFVGHAAAFVVRRPQGARLGVVAGGPAVGGAHGPDSMRYQAAMGGAESSARSARPKSRQVVQDAFARDQSSGRTWSCATKSAWR